MSADQIEAIVTDFRHWLQEAREAPLAEETPGLDVATIVQQFTALRQEVNLQTKASRAQLEQNAQAQTLLQKSLDVIEEQPSEDANDEALKPLLKTLIDAHDSLSLALREVQRLQANLPADAAPGTPPTPEINLRLPYWTRWLGLDHSIRKQLARWQRKQMAPLPEDPTARYRQQLDALLVGYQMSLRRIERALVQHGLEPLASAGDPFDPETMEVAEVVREEGRAASVVLDVLRPGYRWRGKLFRYAQVRVARP